MNPSASNLANITSNDYRVFLEKEKQNFAHKYHVLSNENSPTTGIITSTKTPTDMERSGGQRSLIKCLEVLSKKIAGQTRQSKTRKGSRVNKTYDVRTSQPPGRVMSAEDNENRKYFMQMEAFRREKRNKYEQEASRKVNENRREAPGNQDYFSERERTNKEIRRLTSQKDELSEEDSCSTIAGLEDFVIGKVIGQGAYAIVRIGLHKPTNK
jgi:hypothetical protein